MPRFYKQYLKNKRTTTTLSACMFFFKTEFFSSFFCSLYYHPNDNDETMKFDACIELIIALIENRLAVLEQILFFVCVHIVCVCIVPKVNFYFVVLYSYVETDQIDGENWLILATLFVLA